MPRARHAHVSLLCAALAALGPGALGADWPQFRGSARDAISKETGLLRRWPAAGPKLLWSVPVAQGYAGAAIVGGRVYHQDYDEAAGEWLVLARSLATGAEVWRYREARVIRPNHAITRTVPAADGRYVFAIDPKSGLHCLDARTGKQLWARNLAADYASVIPPWYNGQNPLIEPDRIVVATGGSAILVALDKAAGKEIWRTPNPRKLPLSHASVMPAVLGGVRQYLWGTLGGPLGVSARDGRLLWEYPRKFNVAVAPSPLAADGERVFMTASYDAGSVMIRVRQSGGSFRAERRGGRRRPPSPDRRGRRPRGPRRAAARGSYGGSGVGLARAGRVAARAVEAVLADRAQLLDRPVGTGSSTCAPSTRTRWSAFAAPSCRPRSAASWAGISWGRTSRCGSRSARGPAPSSAARRRP